MAPVQRRGRGVRGHLGGDGRHLRAGFRGRGLDDPCRVTATNSAGSTTAESAPTATIAADPPANTVAPSIAGVARDGQALAANNGTWSGTPVVTFMRQWLRCDNTGASCAAIAGATTGIYTLTSSDVGSTIRVRVTGTNAGGSVIADSAQTGLVAPDPPANTAVPVVTGTTRDTQTLTTTNGSWTGTPTITFTRQWRRCNAAGASCADIAGATGATYTLVAGDVGATIRARVTATNAGGNAATDSAPTSVIAADPPANTSLPVVSGTARDTQTLSSTTGTWTGTPTVSFARQWRRCNASGASCADIAGATGASYVLAPADVGSTIRIRVTASNAGGSAFADSGATAVIAPDPPANTSLPAISGAARDTRR